MTRRWPLHPSPGEGEALSSWLSRLAEAHLMRVEELLRHDLAPPGTDLPDHNTGALDRETLVEVLAALHERTGVPLGEVRQMTIAGWAPWLLDTLGSEPEPGAAFHTYVHQYSVLLTVKERRRRHMPEWRAWLPTDPKRSPMRRACPSCLTAAPTTAYAFTLISQLPLTLSCPQHGHRLEPTLGVLGTFYGWEKPNTVPTAAPATVIAMDERTHEGLRTGMVSLPRRAVHVGVWFRLLRTIIDELSTPVSALSTGSRRSVQRIWETVGQPVRAGMGPWYPYEALTWDRQQAMLEAAATALHLIGTGEVDGHGTLAPLLTLEPYRAVPGGTPPAPDPRNYWQEAMDAADTAIASAQEDPTAARQLLTTLTALTRSEATFQRIREDLLALGIPDDYLPQTLAETAASSPSRRGRLDHAARLSRPCQSRVCGT